MPVVADCCEGFRDVGMLRGTGMLMNTRTLRGRGTLRGQYVVGCHHRLSLGGCLWGWSHSSRCGICLYGGQMWYLVLQFCFPCTPTM